MNNSVSALAALFLKEHPNYRKTLYSLAPLIGVVLAILQTTDMKNLGPFSLDSLAQWFPVAASATVGSVAFANVKSPEDEGEDPGQDLFEDDDDVDSFDPSSSEDMSFS